VLFGGSKIRHVLLGREQGDRWLGSGQAWIGHPPPLMDIERFTGEGHSARICFPPRCLTRRSSPPSLTGVAALGPLFWKDIFRRLLDLAGRFFDPWLCNTTKTSFWPWVLMFLQGPGARPQFFGLLVNALFSLAVISCLLRAPPLAEGSSF